MNIFGVILAGGEGRRMGGADKALLALGGRPLVAHAADRLGPQVEALAVSANGDPERLAFLKLPVLADDMPRGPLSGILTALRWAGAQGASAMVSVAVDTPFFPCDLVPRLCLAAEGTESGLAIAESDGRQHPTFGLWPVALEPALAGFLASGAKPRVMDFAAAQGAAVAPWPDEMAFFNLNTPEDLRRAETLLTVV